MIAMLTERATVYALLAALCFGAGWKINGWRLGEDIANDRVETITVVRYIERAQQEVADTEGAKGHEELEKVIADAAAARTTSSRLRAEAGKLATRLATCNAGTAAERQAREEQSALLANLLADVEQEGRTMAEIADGARARGMTCERTYSGIKSRTNP